MKRTLAAVAVLSVVAAPAVAAPPYAECYRAAQEQLILDDPTVDQLCRGAPSAAPVECFREAERSLLVTQAAAVTLCRCVSSAAPVECYERTKRTTELPDARILSLCSPSQVLGLDLDCRPRR